MSLHQSLALQQMLYIIFSPLGATCDVELKTPTRRINLVVRTANKLYLIIVKVGVNFDQEKRNIIEWEIK